VRNVLFAPLAVAALLAGSASPAAALGGFAHWQNSDAMDSGFGFGAKTDLVSLPLVAAEIRAAWVHFDGAGGHASTDLFPLEAIGRLKLGLLYGGGGFGWYFFSGDGHPDSSFGGAILAGAEFGLLGLGAFAEGRYLFLEADEKDGGGKRKMDGFGASVGVSVPIG